MSVFSVDIEADGAIPSDYSMISLGIVLVDVDLDKTFYAELAPISDKWNPEALAVSGFTREQTLGFESPLTVMIRLDAWIKKVSVGKPMFYSDNNGFDWQFINWYFHHFIGHNPFGHSSTNIGSLYKGMQKDMFVNFKHLRKTKHNHNALADAKSNAEALLAMKSLGLSIKL